MKKRMIPVFLAALSLFCAASAFAEDNASLQEETGVISAGANTGEDRIVLADATPLSSEEMGTLRGGFVDPTGLIYNFAVNVQTDINGSEVFSRSINVSPGANGQLQATAAANLIPKNFPNNLNVGMIGNGAGIAVTNADGTQTMILNQTTAGTPSSIIINPLNDQNIAQKVNMSLTLRNNPVITAATQAAARAGMAARMNMHALGF